MFQSIRQGQQFFILHKGENPRCDVGTVVSVSNPVRYCSKHGYVTGGKKENEKKIRKEKIG